MHWKKLGMALTLGLALWTAGGCGDSAEHRLQRAQIALSSGNPDKAADLAQSVLREKADDPAALLLLGQAQTRLLQLDSARNTFEHLLRVSGNDAKVRREAMVWVYMRMGNLLQQSDFATSADRQALYDWARQWGMEQVQWLRQHAPESGDGDWAQARLLLVDVQRLNLLIARTKKITVDGGGGQAPQQASTAGLEKDRQDRLDEATTLLQSLLQHDPRQFQAAQTYCGLLVESQKTEDLWELAQHMAGQSNLPAALAADLEVGLMTMAPGAHDPKQITALCGKLQDSVDPNRRGSPEWRISQARILLLADKPAEAQVILQQLKKENAKNYNAVLLLARAYHQQDKLADARKELAPLTAAVATPEALTFYGQVLMEMNDLALARDAAMNAINRARETGREYPPARRLFLMIAAKSNQINQASSMVDDYLQSHPTDPQAIGFKLQYEQVRNNREAILKVLEQTEKIDPLLDDHLRILVGGYLYLKDGPKAAKYAQQLAQLRPNDLTVQLLLAQTMLLQKRDEEARQLLLTLREKFPNVGSLEQMLATLYIQGQDYDRAVQTATGIVNSHPDDMQARYTLAQGLAALSLYDEALEQVKIILDKDPHDVQARAMAAAMYQAQGKRDQAAEQLGEIDPQSVSESTSPALLAALKLRQGQMEEAADICNRALARGIPDPMLRSILAEISLRKKQPDQAEENLLGLVRLQPNNARAYSELVRFYLEQKMVDEGLTQFATMETLNIALARVAQAQLLCSVGKYEQADNRLRPVYLPLVRAHDVRAFVVANTLAQIALLRRQDYQQAMAIFDPMIAANLQVAGARLRQIDLAATRESQAQILARLEELAGQTTPQDQQVRLELVQRLVNLRKYDRALALVEELVQAAPKSVGMLRLKSQVLAHMGRFDDAQAVLQQAITLTPEDDVVRRQLAQVQMLQGDFAAAEATYRDAAKLDEGARINALADLGQMYVALGLPTQAKDIFASLEAQGRLKDPRIILALGQAYLAMGKSEQAAEKFRQVPDYAVQQYAAAQVALAQLEQKAGQVDAARDRLEKLAVDPRTVNLATAALLSLDLRNRQVGELVRWADARLSLDNLSLESRRSWLNIRVLMADAQRDYALLGASFDRLAELYVNAQQVTAARILIMAKVDKKEEARQVFLAAGPLDDTFKVPLVAMFGDRQTPGDKTSALDAYVAALSVGDVPAARQALARLQPLRSVFAGDLQGVLDRPDAAGADMQTSYRQLAMALLALRCNLPQMASDLCDQVIARHPDLALPYALQTQAVSDMQQSAGPVLEKLKKALPEASLTLYVGVLEALFHHDDAAGLALAGKLMEREPANDHVRYTMTQLYTNAGQYDQAIALLEKMNAQDGPYTAQVANDLAYLLAEHHPERLAEAAALAQKANDMMKNAPPVLDTVAWVQHLQGQDAKALAVLSRIIIPLAALPEVHYHLGVVYAKLGQNAWARYHLQEAARHPANPVANLADKALAGLAP